MEFKEVMSYLESKGNEQTCKTFARHGAPENMYGVKVADIKPILKKIKINHKLAEELYSTGNSDAQYLAGLIADPNKFTEADFERWAKSSGWYMITDYAVAWNISESPICIEVCKKWIDSDDVLLQECAWSALSCHFSVTVNEELDLAYHKSLVERIEKEIHKAANRVRYSMNGYIIAFGGAFAEMTEYCKEVGDRIGKVEVYMGDTACKVPDIRPYLENMENRGRIGKKKKTAKC